MYSFLKLNIKICILRDTIILGQGNISYYVKFLNMAQYNNCTVLKLICASSYQNSVVR